MKMRSVKTEDWDGDFNQDENICCLIFEQRDGHSVHKQCLNI